MEGSGNRQPSRRGDWSRQFLYGRACRDSWAYDQEAQRRGTIVLPIERNIKREYRRVFPRLEQFLTCFSSALLCPLLLGYVVELMPANINTPVHVDGFGEFGWEIFCRWHSENAYDITPPRRPDYDCLLAARHGR